MVSVPKQLLFQALLIACNAFFASMEIAVISLNTTKLRKLADEGDEKATARRAAREQRPPPQSISYSTGTRPCHNVQLGLQATCPDGYVPEGQDKYCGYSRSLACH